MFSNVVVGVDGGAGGRDAAALAALVAEPSACLTFARVRASDVSSDAELESFGTGGLKMSEEEVEAERGLWPGAADARLIMARSVGEGLEELAAHFTAGLIVIGACQRGGLGRVVVGDDAASVLHHARRSVAVAPRGYSARAQSIRRIGVAYDGSPQSEVAHRLAQALARRLEASLVPVRVAMPHVYAGGVGSGAAYVEDPEDLVRRTRAELGDSGPQVKIVVGQPGQELAAFSKTVDLLVCGTRRNDLLRRVALGSTSEYLARHCHAPLIVAGPDLPEPEGGVQETQAAGGV